MLSGAELHLNESFVMVFKYLQALMKPEYLYRPSQLVKRLYLRFSDDELCYLPWGMPLAVDRDDVIGNAIRALGVYELLVSETILRLVDAGDDALDVGANIGYMSAVLAFKAQEGTVESFEPHPVLFCKLQKNIQLWRADGLKTNIRAHQLAVSSADLDGTLVLPPDFSKNRGVAYVGENAVVTDPKEIAIKLISLDSFLAADRRVRQAASEQVVPPRRDHSRSNLCEHLPFVGRHHLVDAILPLRPAIGGNLKA